MSLHELLKELEELEDCCGEVDDNDIKKIGLLCQDNVATSELAKFVKAISSYGCIDKILERKSLFDLFLLSKKFESSDEIFSLLEWCNGDLTEDCSEGQYVSAIVDDYNDYPCDDEYEKCEDYYYETENLNYFSKEEDDNNSDSDCSDISVEIDLDDEFSIHQNLWFNVQEFKKEVYSKYALYLKAVKESEPYWMKNKLMQKYIDILIKKDSSGNINDNPFPKLGLPKLPNFAVASISYVPKNNTKAHTKIISFPPRTGHTEEQILNYIESKKLKKKKYQEAEMVVIDIHSKLSSCVTTNESEKSRNSQCCRSKLIDFVNVNSKKFGLFKIRQSFDMQYNENANIQLNDEKGGVKEWKHSSERFKGKLLTNKNSFIVSSCGNEEVKEIIEVVKNQLTNKAIIDEGIEKFRKQLENKYIVEDVPHDGSCFFHAMAKHLHIKNAYQQLRKFTMNYIKANRQRFIDIDLVLDEKETFEEYINRMYSNGQWVEQPEMQAIANEFRVNIRIVNSNNSTTEINCANIPNNTIFIGYIMSMHYVALRNIHDDVDSIADIHAKITVS